jgi:hypothetical protein
LRLEWATRAEIQYREVFMSQTMKFHPYAEMYPLLEGEEFEGFKADIAARGVREALKYRMVNGKKEGLDGRNRLRACTELGLPCPEEEVSVEDAEVEHFIDSLNLHRRHLTREQQREQIARRLKEDPAQSNREVARQTGASDKTVATVRDDLEGRAEIPHVDQRTDSQGRGQPANKPRRKKRARSYSALDSDTKKILGDHRATYLEGAMEKLRYITLLPQRQEAARRLAASDADTMKELVEIITAQPCETCWRKGSPTCAHCRKHWPNGFPRREPGEDTDTENRGGPKNGRAKHDFGATDDLLGKLTRSFEACANAYGRSALYQATDDAVKAVAEAWKAWKEDCCHA